MRTFVIGDVHGRLWLLKQLIEQSGIDPKHDKIIFLGDLIDRGENSPGVVEYVWQLHEENPQVVCLRGNHEQMMLDFVDRGDLGWLIPGNGGNRTLAQYGSPIEDTGSFSALRIPRHHLDFIRTTKLYHQDDKAIYVHAGLLPGVPLVAQDAYTLLWSRNPDFYDNYHGKLCIFGHTPTRYIKTGAPREPHDVFVAPCAIGIDTGFRDDDPLSGLEMETLTVYQKFSEQEIEPRRLALPKNGWAAH